ncbi:hypothetical protein MTO96_035869, partial [Rhipicephalus appendiculatus]
VVHSILGRLKSPIDSTCLGNLICVLQYKPHVNLPSTCCICRLMPGLPSSSSVL